MKIHTDRGLWTTGSTPPAPPLVAVLEVAGAVLSWPVDDADAEPQIVFTDVARADWLWRVIGPAGHEAVVAALLEGETGPDTSTVVDLPDVSVDPGSLAPLRRLALGHWLRRWWPASRQDGIADLDAALLDGELAVLTEATHEFFDADAFDADVTDLLRPHAPSFSVLAQHADSRIADLAQSCLALAEDVGVAVDVPAEAPVMAQRRRDDYALAAGAGARPGGAGAAIAEGRDSVRWTAVPPRIFDAAEDTVIWSVRSAGATVEAAVRAEIWGDASSAGIPVHFSAGRYRGAGTLDATGAAIVPLFDGDEPVTEDAAWDHDWSGATVVVGADADESPSARERVRELARSRLSRSDGDPFVAEHLAAEADY